MDVGALVAPGSWATQKYYGYVGAVILPLARQINHMRSAPVRLERPGISLLRLAQTIYA